MHITFPVCDKPGRTFLLRLFLISIDFSCVCDIRIAPLINKFYYLCNYTSLSIQVLMNVVHNVVLNIVLCLNKLLLFNSMFKLKSIKQQM